MAKAKKAKSAAVRQAELRERYRDAGLKWTTVWTHGDEVQEVREFAAGLPKTRKALDKAKS